MGHTVVVEEHDEKFCPATPFEPTIRLAKELASVDQRPVLV